jgi:hypothetical protein
MRKFCKLFLVFSILVSTNLWAQKNGNATGVWATYGMSRLFNADDMALKNYLKPQTTLKYGGGIEKMSLWGNHFGHGFQLSYHDVGQNYSIYDTFSKTTTNIATSLNTIRAGIGFYYRSYNIYKPMKKLRFTCYFGPTFNLSPFFSERYTITDANAKILSDGEFVPLGYRNKLSSVADFDLTKPIYKIATMGFAIAPGIEYTLKKKTTIYLSFRSDISQGNLENREIIKRKIPNPPYETAYSYWDNLIAKGVASPTPINEFNRRPATKSFFVGAQLGVRFYSEPQVDDK